VTDIPPLKRAIATALLFDGSGFLEDEVTGMEIRALTNRIYDVVQEHVGVLDVLDVADVQTPPVAPGRTVAFPLSNGAKLIALLRPDGSSELSMEGITDGRFVNIYGRADAINTRSLVKSLTPPASRPEGE
jgi:hypothetical protein